MGDKGAEGRRISRRDLLRVAGATGAGLTLGAGSYAALRSGTDPRGAGDRGPGLPDLRTVAFHGPHQAGIATPQQEHTHFASFEVVSEDVPEVRDLLRTWSEAGARMSAGRPAGEENESPFLPPDDTDEAIGLSPARLTLTVGFGPTIFEREGDNRFGLAGQWPAALAEIPPMPGDALEETRSGGNLCVQACATTRRWPSTRSGTWPG